MDDHKEPPSYFNGNPQPQQPQVAYTNQQSPYMGQQPLPANGMMYQQTTTVTGQPQMVPIQPMQPMQPHLTGQPSMMTMNANMGVGQQQQQQQQPQMQPQTTGVMMNVTMPGMVPAPNYMTLCQQGQHAMETRYGPCGIITAVLLFPIGLIALFLDVEQRCTRCGATR